MSLWRRPRAKASTYEEVDAVDEEAMREAFTAGCRAKDRTAEQRKDKPNRTHGTHFAAGEKKNGKPKGKSRNSSPDAAAPKIRYFDGTRRLLCRRRRHRRLRQSGEAHPEAAAEKAVGPLVVVPETISSWHEGELDS